LPNGLAAQRRGIVRDCLFASTPPSQNASIDGGNQLVQCAQA